MIVMLGLCVVLVVIDALGAPHWAHWLVWGALLATCLAQALIAVLEGVEAARTLRRLMRR